MSAKIEAFGLEHLPAADCGRQAMQNEGKLLTSVIGIIIAETLSGIVDKSLLPDDEKN